MTTALLGLTFSEVKEELIACGINPIHAKSLWRFIQKEALTNLDACDFSPPLQRWADENIGDAKRFSLQSLELADHINSGDGLTTKFLFKLADGQVIESVLMGYDGRYTACISSQAGCAMGCVFCATGQMGFVRHLTVAEIVGQVQYLRRELKRIAPLKRLRNLVLMGMGEPLHNYDSVIKALGIISDVRGASVGPAKIAISTVGVVPSILRLAEEAQPYNLAVSLHGSTEEERSSLVPASKKWNLEMLMNACRSYGKTTGKRIFFEWTLIVVKNDSEETAQRLAKLLEGMDGHVNLIPLNPTGGFDGKPSDSGAKFQRVLRAAGFPCTFRQRRGIDVAAGCGMLKAERLKKGAQN